MFERAKHSADWQLRRATSGFRVLPEFLGIGAQRSGTTSLFTFLAEHPNVFPSFRKEVHFFDIHHDRGESWYRSNFALARQLRPGYTTGEATPNYLAHSEAPQRAFDLVPEAKLIALLRDPVDRAFSSWKLNQRMGWETREFAQAVEEEIALGLEMDRPSTLPADISQAKPGTLRWSYVLKSRYAGHIERWVELFGSDQLLVVQSERLFQDPVPNLKIICDFLEIESSKLGQFPRVNTTPSRQLDQGTRRLLTEFFADSNQRLETLTGMRFDWPARG